jgi:hypothetical protein
MDTKGQHHVSSWNRTPFGCLSSQQRGRRPSITEALAEIATRH